MKIISISNNKGGVGKTTTTVNVAAAMQLLNKKVLVIDMDHQAQSTYHFGINPNNITESIYDVLKGEKIYKDIIGHRGV
jgi:chromosome partitioning protein